MHDDLLSEEKNNPQNWQKREMKRTKKQALEKQTNRRASRDYASTHIILL